MIEQDTAADNSDEVWLSCPDCDNGKCDDACTSCSGTGRITLIFGDEVHTKSCDICGGKGEFPRYNCPTCKGVGQLPKSEVIALLNKRKKDEQKRIADAEARAAEASKAYEANSRVRAIESAAREKAHAVKLARRSREISISLPISLLGCSIVGVPIGSTLGSANSIGPYLGALFAVIIAIATVISCTRLDQREDYLTVPIVGMCEAVIWTLVSGGAQFKKATSEGLFFGIIGGALGLFAGVIATLIMAVPVVVISILLSKGIHSLVARLLP